MTLEGYIYWGALVVGAETRHHVPDTEHRCQVTALDGRTQAVRCGHCDCRDAADLRALFHDLSNHLATFSIILETVDDDLMPAANRCHVLMMRTQTERMLALLRDAVEQDMSPEPVDVRALIEEVVSVANARRQAVVTMEHGAPRWLRTRPAALWRVVANVVDNAVRAAGPTGRVEVTVQDRSRNVVIEVADNGPGFGKAPAGTASLGLGIAASLARKCEGRMEMFSTYPRGVRVRLEFHDLEPDLAPLDLDVPTGLFAGAAAQSGR